MRTLIITAMMLVLPGFAAGPVGAQDAAQASTSRLIDGGVALGAAGFLGGHWLGARAETAFRGWRGDDLQRCADECGSTGALILSVLAGSTGVAAGVHLFNDSRGDFAQEWLASLGIGTVGTGVVLLVAKPWEQRPGSLWRDVLLGATYLVAIPAAQLITTIHIERATAQHNTTAATRPQFSVRIPVSW